MYIEIQQIREPGQTQAFQNDGDFYTQPENSNSLEMCHVQRLKIYGGLSSIFNSLFSF